MVVTRICDMQLPLAGEWWTLYESAFPASERRGKLQHAAALQEAAFHCLHLADASGFAGLLAYWQWEKLCYIEHLAIVPSRRGQGLGHRALKLVPAPAILEIEPVVDASTARRLAFYESCGYTRLVYPHVQLAYQQGEADIPLWLLSRPVLDTRALAEFESLYHSGPMRYRDGA